MLMANSTVQKETPFLPVMPEPLGFIVLFMSHEYLPRALHPLLFDCVYVQCLITGKIVNNIFSLRRARKSFWELLGWDLFTAEINNKILLIVV